MKSVRSSALTVAVVLAAISIFSWTAAPGVFAHEGKKSSQSFKLRGAFAGGYDGFLLFGGTLINHNGIQTLTFDGAGNFSGTETFNLVGAAGQLTCVGTLSGTDSLGDDGNGMLALTFTANANQPECPPSSSTDASFVLSEDDRTIDLVTTGSPAPGNAVHIHVVLHRQ